MCLITDTDPKTDSGRCDGAIRYVMSYVRVQLVSFPVLIFRRHVFALTKVQWDKYDGLPCCFPTTLVLIWRCFGSLPLWCLCRRTNMMPASVISAEPLLIHWQTSSAISSSLQIILPHGYSYKVSCARPDYAVICNFWHPGTLTRQSARMSKITNDVGLQLNSVWHMMLYTWQQWASKCYRQSFSNDRKWTVTCRATFGLGRKYKTVFRCHSITVTDRA